MVASQNQIASQIGSRVLEDGGTAVDAAVATAFALAVVHPSAGNIGGGGFMVYRPSSGEPVAYDFREVAPARATATMFLVDGRYSSEVHHNSYLAVGVPGTVAGLHLAWKDAGKLPWRRLIRPGHRARPRRFSAERRPGPVVERSGAGSAHATVAGGRGPVLEERHAVRRAVNFSNSQTWPGRSSALRHRARPGFTRAKRSPHREGDGVARRVDHPRRSQALRRQETRADRRKLPWVRCDLDAAIELRRRGAGRDAEHPRGLRPRVDGSGFGIVNPLDDRSDASRLSARPSAQSANGTQLVTDTGSGPCSPTSPGPVARIGPSRWRGRRHWRRGSDRSEPSPADPTPVDGCYASP